MTYIGKKNSAFVEIFHDGYSHRAAIFCNFIIVARQIKSSTLRFSPGQNVNSQEH